MVVVSAWSDLEGGVFPHETLSCWLVLELSCGHQLKLVFWIFTAVAEVGGSISIVGYTLRILGSVSMDRKVLYYSL